jgi:hypothetical protein
MKKILKTLEAFAPVAGSLIWLYFVACFAFAIAEIILRILEAIIKYLF